MMGIQVGANVKRLLVVLQRVGLIQNLQEKEFLDFLEGNWISEIRKK